ncbi:PREDICTED: receptor protein kinase-like protein ZAR1 [Lupinus angustifolius]|uniref:receptor protein kinase-like protein ZAR1 n=1 Tax=Lupinus angustifolius TaxID=3871 RepID=UPI00092F26B4|nr:PREDICTED: receptor protein kinase-like protein ZAR1 [Lupinus angustifolius]
MHHHHHFLFLLLLHIFLLFFFPSTFSLNSDGLSLLALKSAITFDPNGALKTWSQTDPTPCNWNGVVCFQNRVTQLALPNNSLTGYLPSELGLLTSLKRLSLPHNNFSNSIPINLFNATNLVVLDLSHNSLSGFIPSEIHSLRLLRHVDISSNSLTGSLPESLSELIGLVGTLNLSFNHFSGGVPASLGKLPVAVSIDLRYNNLTGKIPQVGSLLNQGPTAFSGNPGLCGFPLQNACPEAEKPPGIVTSTQYEPQNPKAVSSGGEEEKGTGGSGGRGGSVAVAVISGISLFVAVVSLSLWIFRRRLNALEEGNLRKGKLEIGVGNDLGGEGQNGKFVVIDEGFGLELEDLLRASAYVVGKSRSGIVYKVVGAGKGLGGAASATVVAVRRLSEGDDATWRFKEFESEVEAIARIRHPNVVPLRAYYFAHDEKLIITDFIRNGSLSTALHGGPSNSLPPLSWAVRLKIAQEAARGLTYIHEFSGRKYVHGNLKSTKILLDDDLRPYISGFGLTRLSLGTTKCTTLAPKRQNSNQSSLSSAMGSMTASNYYLAPEVRMAGGKFTQKCDVYSFGLVLLELLTGKQHNFGLENDDMVLECFVRKAFKEEQPLSEIIDPTLLPEVYAKKQVVAAFHVALNCTELDPELRPRMRTVYESLDRIKIQ